MAIREGNSLIKRYSYPMCSRELVVSTPTASNPFANNTESYSFTRGLAEVCTIQSPSYNMLQALPEGVDLSRTFVIYTNTFLVPSVEGSARLADAIYIPSCYFSDNTPSEYGGWHTVSQVKYRSSGIITHTQAILTKDSYLEDEKGLQQYPDTTNLITSIPDKATLQSGAWASGWISENT